MAASARHAVAAGVARAPRLRTSGSAWRVCRAGGKNDHRDRTSAVVRDISSKMSEELRHLRRNFYIGPGLAPLVAAGDFRPFLMARRRA